MVVAFAPRFFQVSTYMVISGTRILMPETSAREVMGLVAIIAPRMEAVVQNRGFTPESAMNPVEASRMVS